MTRKRRRQGELAPTPPAEQGPGWGMVDLVLAAGVLLLLLLAWWSRYALNPDGVSYLDLAARAEARDFSGFVQGYWSPLYPALIGALGLVGGGSPLERVVVAHLVNLVSTLAALALLRHWGRRLGTPRAGLALLLAYLLVSSGLPRLEAVTPDALLLATTAWLGYELLAWEGARWIRTGLLLGLTFLVKTSSWPWLLLSVPLRLWGAPDRAARVAVLRASAVAAAVMALWVVPLSLEAGRATLGSSGRLNYCWYIASCDSRTPDTHRGDHAAYRDDAVAGGPNVRWARFDEADRWTYAPWSDPTAWAAGIGTEQRGTPTVTKALAYWGRQAGWSFGFWLLPLILVVLLPEWIRSGRLFPDQRAAAALFVLGLLGIVQFVAVHAEPRLIAPPALLAALAVIHRSAAATDRLGGGWARVIAVAGAATLFGYGIERLKDGPSAAARLSASVGSLAATEAQLRAGGLSQERIVVFGPALPVAAAAYLSGAHIVAQVLPGSVDPLLDRSPEAQREAFTRLFGGLAQVAWLTDPDGGVTLVRIPARPEATP